MPELDDAQLLDAIASRQSREAFEELYARYEASACSLARYLTGKPGLIEEVVQDAMFRVWRYAKTYDPSKGSPRTWILRPKGPMVLWLIWPPASVEFTTIGSPPLR